MIQVILLSFREYFEAFLLITGLSLICYKYGINKTKEIALGATLAFLFAINLNMYIFATGVQFLQESQLTYLEGWLLISSSILIAFFAFPFHSYIWKHVEKKVATMEQRIQQESFGFDWILFLFVFLLTLKEGFEALIFTSGVALSGSTNGIENMVGLVFGFLFASGLAYLVRRTALFLHVNKIFTIMAFFVLLGMASLFREGLQIVTQMPYELSDIIAALYGLIVYVLFIRAIPNKS